MTTIEALLGPAAVHRIGWALLHSLWQSAAVALVLAVALRRLRRAPAEARYLAACAALVAMAALPAATSVVLTPARGPEAAAGSVTPTHQPVAIGGAARDIATIGPRSWPRSAWLPPSARPRVLLSGLVAAWTAGVAVLTLRLLGGWLLVRRLARRARPLAGPGEEALARLARTLRIRKAVRLLESSLVRVPAVIGGLRPAILLPASALTGFPPRQLEALLAHELAHICRHDYLVNLAQSAIEVLLFYHPAAWWVSRVIRSERENCCDDMAVRACGDRLSYARALAAMEGLRDRKRRFLLSPAADDGPLLSRIRRILNMEVESMSRFPLASLGVPLLIGALLLPGASAQPPRGPEASPRGDEEMPAAGRSSPGRDPDIKTVYVPVFRSNSFRRDVNFMLTELVQKRIEQRTRYKVVGAPEQGDTILEGTINLADKNLAVEDPFNLTHRFTGRIEVTARWTHNPPLEQQKKPHAAIISEAFTFNPEGDGTSETAFYRTCKSLAKQIVDMIERHDRTPHAVEPGPEKKPAVSLPVLPSTQRVTRILPRNDSPNFSVETLKSDDVEITVIRGGVRIVSEAKQFGISELSADSVIIWRRVDPKALGGFSVGPDGEQIENAVRPMEVFLEGNVVFFQDARKVAGNGDQKTFRAKKAYYDFRTDRFVGLKD